MLCVLGNGMVIAPDALLAELGRLHEAGVRFDGRLFVSNRAHVLLPLPRRARPGARGGARADQDRHHRARHRPGLREQGLALRPAHVPTSSPPTSTTACGRCWRASRRSCRAWGRRSRCGTRRPSPTSAAPGARSSRPALRDTERLLNDWIAAGKSLLFEGAQGTLLDVDHGTYPFVTSSNTTAGGACTGTGVPPHPPRRRDRRAQGLHHARRRRPLPQRARRARRASSCASAATSSAPSPAGRAAAAGSTLVAARYARLLNGVDAIALTKLDVLDDFDEIPVCVGYRVHGEVLRELPASRHALESAEPVLRAVKGWKRSTVGVLEVADLPPAARDYMALIEEEVGAPVALVSTGPRREETALTRAIPPSRASPPAGWPPCSRSAEARRAGSDQPSILHPGG